MSPKSGPSERSKARSNLDRVLYDDAGARRVPHTSALDRAIVALRSSALWRYCETQPLGPLYLLPTREFIRELGRVCLGLGRSVLEVGAGDGLLARALAEAAPSLRIRATDAGTWSNPAARMTPTERRRWEGLPLAGVTLGPEVERIDGVAAVRRYEPDVVIASWLPPGPLLSRIIRAPCRFVIDIGAGGGVTAEGAWDWRFNHEFLDRVERWTRCRLDGRPAVKRHSRVTLYYGRRHPDFHEERPRKDDWLWQFRPSRGLKRPRGKSWDRPRATR
jgi:hypothetical protein